MADTLPHLKHWSFSVDIEGLGWLTIDTPKAPVNTLSRESITELDSNVTAIEGMIPAGVQVYVASTPVDFRKGATGLMALVRDGGADPFSGALYVFRSKRADRIKAVWFDGTGVCLFAKTLEEAQFCWPRIGPATVRLNHTQLLALVDGLDWKKVRPVAVRRPQSMG